MKNLFTACLAALMFVSVAPATNYHVAMKGKDANPGTAAAPFRTIQHAADVAQPGDVITVHKGVYRERIAPPRGGESDAKRIVYEAAAGETVEITGAEIIKSWEKAGDGVWKVVLPNSFFGNFNPYSDLIHGDWFNPLKRNHHTGAVYLNGDWLIEAATLDEVMKPAGTTPLWFGQVDGANTTIWAQFKGNPNKQTVEINVRQTVFYPQKTGMNYITVRGFILERAATNWAPPTAEQIGLIGAHWSKGWIIENNTVRYSTCSGISLGKYGDQWDNTSANSAAGYVKTIDRALANGWSEDNIGHHIVRNNTISYCEQAGIVGSLGAAFSTVTNNTIHDIHVRQLFSGAEMAGIKFHAAIDVEISHNHIYRTVRGLWLDWMAQGAHVSANLFHDNASEDIFVEVDHGPFLIDNNLLLSKTSLRDVSQGGAYAHNLFGGSLHIHDYDRRQTPFMKPHSTALAGMHDNPRGDDRYFNNIFVGAADLRHYDDGQMPCRMDGNAFLNGAKPARFEIQPQVKPDFDPAINLSEAAGGFYLEMKFDPAWTQERGHRLATTELLGKAAISNAAYEQPDGQPRSLNHDYFDRNRSDANPTPGPFENPGSGELKLKVW